MQRAVGIIRDEMRRMVLLATAACACSAPPSFGRLEAEGRWADGEPIAFSEPAEVLGSSGGMVDIVAVRPDRARLIGIRVRYDPAQISEPGTYMLDPAPLGRLEVYLVRPDEGPGAVVPSNAEYEASSGEVRFDALPRAGRSRLVQGTLRDVRLARQGTLILTLDQGVFHGERP